MRLVLVLLLLFIAINIGSRCRLTEAAPPPGCTRIGATGLVFCPNPGDTP